MAAIKVGTSDISAVYVGSASVSKIYVGTTQVWPAQSASFSIDPTSLTGRTNSSGTATITFSQGVSNYVFISSPAWVTVTEIVSSNLTTGLTVSYTANTGSQRSGNIQFSAGGSTFSVAISQSATSTVSVTGVSLNKTSTTITAGSTEQLTATITPANATNQNVTWSSSNTSVATVSSSGLVTAVAAGSATITVTTQDGGYQASCAATIAAATFSVSPSDLTFAHNESTVYSAKKLTITTTQSWTVTSITSTFAINNNVTSGTGDTDLWIYPINANTGSNTDKTGSIKIKPNVGSEVSIGLVQYAQTYSMSVTPNSLTFDYDDNTYAEGQTVTIVSDHSWTAAIQSGDFAIGSNGSTTASGTSGTTTLTIYPTSNNSGVSDKTGLFRVTGTGSGFVRYVSLTQDYNHALDVELVDSLSFVGTGETKYITATSGTITSWQITSAPNWCSYTSGVVQSSSIPITASANNGSEARMYDLVLTVNGIEGYIVALDQPSASAVNYTFTIVPSPSDATVTINGSTRTSYSCPAGTSITWSVAKTNYVTQSGNYTMTAQNHTENVTLVYNYTLSVSPNSLSFDYDKYGYVSGSKLVTITSNQSWTMTATGVFRIGSSAATTASGSGNGSYSIFPNSSNTGSSARTGTLTITGANSGLATVSLTQNYNTNALQSLSIDGPDTLDIQDASAYTVSYTPSGTSQTAVEWSVSGNANGELMDMGGYDAYVIYPTNNASVGDTVTVTVTSTVVSGKSASKSVTIVDELGPAEEPIDSVTVSGSDTIYTTTNQATYTATVLPATAEDKSVTWSVTGPDASKLSINQNGVVTVKSTATYLGQANVVATSNADPSVSGSLTIMFRYRT